MFTSNFYLQTLCFHLGMTEAFIWDYETENQRLTQRAETAKILQEIHNEIIKDDRRLIYSHKVIHRDKLNHCLLELSADNLCKQFRPRSGPTKCRA